MSKNSNGMNPKSIPKCVGIIMDGNRRFARSKGLPLFEGHRRGLEKVKELIGWAKELDVAYVVLFALSTENWNRTRDELTYLMGLFKLMLTKELEAMRQAGVRVRCVGERGRFSPELQKLMAEAEERTALNKELTIVLALSYGGRAEIIDAANRAIASGESKVTEESFARHLWTAGMPDPDLIIRTSGEMRLSGFLPWQSVYSELFFAKTYWPDFSREEFQAILEEFSKRQRRNGK
ncbi:MAG: di-trans,poly-cis-decaprenylcistransferase [Candidatus Taylorbacteria bacterium]|nr:di-trans,poly-cis-decaprenylcistransferase [Candidatus Taylorbacteria bacterium]